jgi:hypothetical protein
MSNHPRLRTYNFKGLSTWAQNKCLSCHRYLPKHGKDYCDKCRKERHNELSRLSYNKLLRKPKIDNKTKENSFRKWIYRHIETLNIGDVF